MSDYPDPEEEFELMYGDELDYLRTQEEETPTLQAPQPTQSSQLTQRSGPCENSNINTINSRKRSVDELFGNIDDIDDGYEHIKEIELPKPKKLKSNKDDNVEKLALIEHILELRKQVQETMNNDGVSSKNKQFPMFRDNILDNVSLRVPRYPFTALTSPDGDRLYIRTHSEKYFEEEVKNMSKVLNYGANSGVSGPLGIEFENIWHEAHENLVNKQSAPGDIPAPTYTPAEGLWVEVYKPKKYMDLLSDEATNRTLLRWVKLWDRIVFNRRTKRAANLTQFQKNIFEVEDDHRPKYKIVLLAGPPGLGKTTLAHLVALHAGYKPMEVNASDERTPDAFKRVLDNATTMTSVLDSEKRPNCVIFDEIDGAPTTAIDYLCKYVQGSIKQKSKHSKANKTGEEVKKERKIILKRPIIAICNDAYVLSLRVLRQMALVLHVPAISAARLTQRLLEISLREELKITRHALTTLAEKSNCDVRNCLSLLQFFKVRNEQVLGQNSVSLEQILNVNHLKDVNKGLFEVWSDIFHLKRNKDNSVPTLEDRRCKIQRATGSFDFDKLSTGIFENYVRLSSVKDNVHNAQDALAWFSKMDILNKHIMHGQNFQLSGYLTWGFVKWHFAFGNYPHSHSQRVFPKKIQQNFRKPGDNATNSQFVNADNTKILFPTTSSDVRMKAQKTDATYSDLLKHMSPQIRSYVTKSSLVLDIIPMLNFIINPPLRPVNLHLYTQNEKDELSRVVCTMIDYGLNYIQERTLEGTYAFNLDPNTEELGKFTSANKSMATRSLSYSNKQLVAREIELEKMRRLELRKHKNPAVYNTKVHEKKKAHLSEEGDNAQVPNHMVKLAAKKLNIKSPKARNFFSFVRKDIASNADNQPSKGFVCKGIYFQFKEGHTNAVKKPIKISSLLND